jgi:hypothetical protein
VHALCDIQRHLQRMHAVGLPLLAQRGGGGGAERTASERRGRMAFNGLGSEFALEWWNSGSLARDLYLLPR